MPQSTSAYADRIVGLPPRSSPLKTKRRMRTGSSSDSVQTSSSSSSTNAQFQMMHISVSILVLEGLIMECNVPKEQLKVELSNTINSINTSSMAGNIPVTAVVSCFKNISGSRAIATHVPSLPLGNPKETLGSKNYQFICRWPVDFDPSGDALSTFKCNRLMKKEYTINHDDQLDTFTYGYDAEEIELNVCLMRGSEMITLGAANLVITGEEVGEMTVDLPINVTKGAAKRDRKARSPSPLRRTGSKLFGKGKASTKVMKAKAFPGDARRKYRLSEQSMIRLRVKVNPATRPSFDEFGQEPNENLYHSYYTHPNVQVMRTNKLVPSSRQYDKRHLHLRPRSMSNPRSVSAQVHISPTMNNRSSSLVNGRERMYSDEYIEHHDAAPHRFIPSGNSKLGMRRHSGFGEIYNVRRDARENEHIPHEYQRQDFHPRPKIPIIPPDKRKSLHKRTTGSRTEPSSVKLEQKESKTIFETILSHGASFISGNASIDDKKDTTRDCRRPTHPHRTFPKSSNSCVSSSSSGSEYESDSDCSDSTYEFSRTGRGRSPPRRAPLRSRTGAR